MNQRGWIVLMAALATVFGLSLWFSAAGSFADASPARREIERQMEQERDQAKVAPPAEAPSPPAREEAPVVAAPESMTAPPLPSFVPRAEGTPRPPKHPVDPEKLAQESALLAQAKQNVESDPQLALRQANALRQQFPEGALVKDTELVRVEAYLRLGRREDAEALGKKLVGKEPSTRKTIDRLLEEIRQN